MVWRMRLIFTIALTLLFAIPAPAFADCSESACVDVYTHDNQIIIEARKGDANTTTKRAPRPQPSATLWFPPKPSPAPYVKRTYKPRTAKPRTYTQKVNLSDRLTKLVPTAGIAFQPEFEALTHVPVIFWIDLPKIFVSRVDIIGEIVDVTLRPGFIWSYGDGSIWATSDTGSPFPNQSITHTYRKPGTYAVTVITTWNGSFSHNGAVRAITGHVIKTSVATVTVVSAPTRFTK